MVLQKDTQSSPVYSNFIKYSTKNKAAQKIALKKEQSHVFDQAKKHGLIDIAKGSGGLRSSSKLRQQSISSKLLHKKESVHSLTSTVKKSSKHDSIIINQSRESAMQIYNQALPMKSNKNHLVPQKDPSRVK